MANFQPLRRTGTSSPARSLQWRLRSEASCLCRYGSFQSLHNGSLGMSNVLSEEEKQQVIALGKLGWSLRRIEEVTGVRRETASAYLRTAGVVVCLPGW